MNNKYDVIDCCRSCSSKNIVEVLDSGWQPLANSLKKNADDFEEKYPLTTVFCSDCSLFQIKETVKKEILFDQYVWVTGTSGVAKEYSQLFYERTINIAKIKRGDLVVEIASNDGTFLRPFLKNGYRVLGIEPARNIAQIAEESGIETLPLYWNSKTVRQIMSRYGIPKVIIARNVIPHVSELHDVIKSINLALTDGGVGLIEFHSAGVILQELHYDSIYHEHLCYFSIQSIQALLNRFALFPFHIDFSPISGGSYVLYFSKEKREPNEKYVQLLKQEKSQSINKLSLWRKFASRCIQHKQKTKSLLQKFAGKTIVGFGASARSSSYLNFCGITNSEIKAIIDNNKLKQGLYSPGSSIPIVAIEEGFKMKPDILFILAWNFKDEIIKECQKKGYRGDYLIPFPNTPYLLRRKKLEAV